MSLRGILQQLVAAPPSGPVYDYDFEALTATAKFSEPGWVSGNSNTWEVYAPGGGNKIIYPNNATDTLTYDMGKDDMTSTAWFYSHQWSSLGGPVARYLDYNNFLLAECVKGDGLKLYVKQGGSFTQLGSAYPETFPENAAYRVDLVVSGSNVEVLLNGVSRITHTLGAYTLGQRAGVFSETYSYIDRMSAE
jgi:hypothetical protein